MTILPKAKHIEGYVIINNATQAMTIEVNDNGEAILTLSGRPVSPDRRYHTVKDMAASFDYMYYSSMDRLEREQYNFIPDWILKLPVLYPGDFKPSAKVEDNKGKEITPPPPPLVETGKLSVKPKGTANDKK